jgi:hypothetical protein
MITVTIKKIASAQQVGEYKPTNIDLSKKEADFRLVQVAPYYIRWKSGEGQTVTLRQLNKLKHNHTWVTDF